jgi:RES domain-containing protein
VRAWRISNQQYARLLNGAGAAINGQRWNRQGVPALYLGLSPTICVLETFVHLGSILPSNLILIELDLPEDTNLYFTPLTESLPSAWCESSASNETQNYGTAFLEESAYLGLIVPSAIVREDTNIIINPRHPAAKQIKIVNERPFNFDARMLK